MSTGKPIQSGWVLLSFEHYAQEDMPFLKEAMAADNHVIQQASIFPTFEQVALLASQEPDLSLHDAINAFAER